ncbi:uncharacterized protein C8A04DRAFT_31094 [Dichotomopilus funicola]|uniref:Uncharacterized protein n=1 Tax=Dichotomopilus funicola TaxID=1934379 RepID=A0AAN6UYH2_9PEZI|nr:hypothetical protein C8A04DRAFT_31094 [Dichotomopilus funicola]
MRSARSALSWAFVAALLQPCAAQQQKTCYYPDGSIAKGDHPCDTDAEHSPCCAGDVLANQCLANKLCLSPKGRYARGSCTDPTWTSPDCPQYCIANNLTNGADLSLCTSLSNPSPSFCCVGASDCCAQQSSQFILRPAPYDTWAVWDKDNNRYDVIAPLSSSSSSSSSSSTGTKTTTSPSATGTGASSQSHETGTHPPATLAISTNPNAADATAGAVGPHTTSSGTLSDQTPSSTGLSTGAQAGIGVGAAIGALLLAAVAFLGWKLYRASQTSGIAEQWAWDMEEQRRREAEARAAAAAGTGAGTGVEVPAPVYYAQLDGGMVKHELGSEVASYELQGGDGRRGELGTSPVYGGESPVTQGWGHR